MYLHIPPSTVFFAGFVVGVIATIIVKAMFGKK